MFQENTIIMGGGSSGGGGGGGDGHAGLTGVGDVLNMNHGNTLTGKRRKGESHHTVAVSDVETKPGPHK